jgi:hypothetical protein
MNIEQYIVRQKKEARDLFLFILILDTISMLSLIFWAVSSS